MNTDYSFHLRWCFLGVAELRTLPIGKRMRVDQVGRPFSKNPSMIIVIITKLVSGKRDDFLRLLFFCIWLLSLSESLRYIIGYRCDTSSDRRYKIAHFDKCPPVHMKRGWCGKNEKMNSLSTRERKDICMLQSPTHHSECNSAIPS